MTIKSQPTILVDRVINGSLVTRGLAAGVLALALNAMVFILAPVLLGVTLAVPVMGPGTPIVPLPFWSVVLATLVPTAGAVGLLALLQRFTSRVVRYFRVIAVVFLLLSLGAPLSQPVPLSVRMTLASMHIITAAVIVGVLTAQRK